jgi:alpha 1,2-mannosyltransferase
VFLGSEDEYNSTYCEELLPRLNAHCRIISSIYDLAPELAKPEHFQFKLWSIFFSSFSDVLFLDADAFPGNNPDSLFHREPYRSRGLVVWPDIFANTVSEDYFRISGVEDYPLSTRLAAESGVIMLSKRKHASSLILMAYYNYYGPDYYYPLLCQGSHGAGDKDTFMHAAMAMNLPFWDVKEPPSVMGRWRAKNATEKDGEKEFLLVGLGQADPARDYEDEMAKARPKAKAQKTVRPLFLHNHIHKLDPKTIINDDALLKDDDGAWTRMWGSQEDVVKRFGHDLEKTVWQEIRGASCELGYDSCGKTTEYYNSVFAS